MIEELKTWLDERIETTGSRSAKVAFAQVRNRIWHLENPDIPTAAPAKPTPPPAVTPAVNQDDILS